MTHINLNDKELVFYRYRLHLERKKTLVKCNQEIPTALVRQQLVTKAGRSCGEGHLLRASGPGFSPWYHHKKINE